MTQQVNTLLRKAREDRGLSQVQLARLAGVSQRAISGYESGGRIPTADVAIRLAQILGLDWQKFVRAFSVD